ncbi:MULTISPECIES: winged helix-turn-helix domain-containing protein [Paenibacillus]|nr:MULTISPECIES: helix-turn-helix domain-containing protein [Paenibacillus]
MALIETKVLKTIEEIRIFSDPYRMKIMNFFHKSDHPATIKEIADRMGEVPAKVYYHARKLESIGLLELVETKQINGITAKFYKAYDGTVNISRDEADDESIKEIFRSESQKLASNMFDAAKEKYLASSEAGRKRTGTLSNSDVYLTKEEAEEFLKLAIEFAQTHSRRTRSEQAEYHLFLSLSAVSEDGLKSK